ncbi:MAG: hypothetical protein CSA65_04410 [Proteobacteria bacterium]|nr:MAG: hypothetical protein CSA65_04410 [Pseudomonadota bacterium]
MIQLDREQAARELAALARAIAARGALVAGLGAVACRLEDGRLLATPSGRSLRALRAEQVVMSPSELDEAAGLCVAAFDRRPDAAWVSVTQPPAVMALTMAGITVGRCLLAAPLAEIAEAAGHPDAEVAVGVALSAGLTGADDVLLERFSLVSVAADATTLEARLERLEHAAEVTARARTLGGEVAPRSEGTLSALAAGLESLGLRVGPDCARCNGCSLGRRHRGAPDAFGERLDAAIGRHLQRSAQGS